MEKEGLKVEGYRGTWYVVRECASSVYNFPFIKGTATRYDGKMYLLESEIWGEDAAHLIVTKNLEVLADEVWNGFPDLIVEGMY